MSVFKGTTFEHETLKFLSKFNMNLCRFGGPNDKGVSEFIITTD
jgi:hypothetical protein